MVIEGLRAAQDLRPISLHHQSITRKKSASGAKGTIAGAERVTAPQVKAIIRAALHVINWIPFTIDNQLAILVLSS
jgi:hypothetical protein